MWGYGLTWGWGGVGWGGVGWGGVGWGGVGWGGVGWGGVGWGGGGGMAYGTGTRHSPVRGYGLTLLAPRTAENFTWQLCLGRCQVWPAFWRV
jgi:hypothetical protein